jgi:hypothetical protein
VGGRSGLGWAASKYTASEDGVHEVHTWGRKQGTSPARSLDHCSMRDCNTARGVGQLWQEAHSITAAHALLPSSAPPSHSLFVCFAAFSAFCLSALTSPAAFSTSLASAAVMLTQPSLMMVLMRTLKDLASTWGITYLGVRRVGRGGVRGGASVEIRMSHR